MIAMAMYA
jgi:hypothetical protein